jgi:hypothetical protein
MKNWLFERQLGGDRKLLPYWICPADWGVILVWNNRNLSIAFHYRILDLIHSF